MGASRIAVPPRPKQQEPYPTAVRGHLTPPIIVKESLAGMGGSISVESMPGKGSAFTIHLSALPENNEYAPAAASGGEDSHAV